eukprot:gene3845-15141_t
MEELFTVGKHQKSEMETERKHPAELSNSGVERAVLDVGQRQRRKLLCIFSHFAQNYGLFLDIAKHLTETSSDDHDVIEKLSDSSFRRSAFKKADDESINSRLKKFGKIVRKTMKSLDRMLETIETIDKLRRNLRKILHFAK